MDKQEIKDFLVGLGCKVDRMGNPIMNVIKVNAVTGERMHKKIRFKLQSKSVRVELQVPNAESTTSYSANSWIRIDGEYYSRILKAEDGTVVIGTYTLNPNTRSA